MRNAGAVFGAGSIGLLCIAAFVLGRGGATRNAPEEPAAAATPRAIAWLRDAYGPVLVGGSNGRSAAASLTDVRGGAFVETGSTSRGVLDLRAAGTAIAGPETLLQVVPEEWDGASLRPTRLRFHRGSFRAEALSGGGGGLQVDLGERGILEVPPGGAAILVSEGDRVAVSMLRHGGTVLAGGKQTLLAEGEALRLLGGGAAPGAPVALPAAPPSGGGNVQAKLFAGTEGKAKPRFRFAGETGKVRVVVARDELLRDVVAEATTDKDGAQLVEGLEPGNYFWAAARIDPALSLPGRYSAARPLAVVAGPRPDAVDEVPEVAVVIGGASTTVFYSTAEPPLVGLDWKGVTDPRGFQVAVAADARFKKIVARDTMEESRYTLGSLAPGVYFWRVTVPGGPQQQGRFTLRRSNGPPRVTQVSRVSEEFDRSQIFFQRELPPVEFAFKADARAAKYRLQVARDKGFASVVATREAAKSPVKLEAGALREGELHWRVQRLKADGTVFYPGKVQGLALKFDPENPSLELAEPDPDEQVKGDTVRVAGLAPLDSELWINGVAVSIDGRGRFSTDVQIDPREPEVVVKCVRGGRYFAYYVRRLRPARV